MGEHGLCQKQIEGTGDLKGLVRTGDRDHRISTEFGEQRVVAGATVAPCVRDVEHVAPEALRGLDGAELVARHRLDDPARLPPA